MTLDSKPQIVRRDVVRLALLAFVISVPVVAWAAEVGVALTASHAIGLLLIGLAAAIWIADRPPLPRDIPMASTAAFVVVAVISVALVQSRPDITVLTDSMHAKSLKQLIGLGFGISVFLALYCLLQWYGLGGEVLRRHYWTTAAVAVLTIVQYGIAQIDMTSPLAAFPVRNSTLGATRDLSLMYGFPRVALTLVEPSMLGGYLLTGWGFWLNVLDRPSVISERRRSLALLSGVVLTAAIIITGSRLAYVMLGLLAIAAFAVRPRRVLRAGLLSAGILAGLLLTGLDHGRSLMTSLIPKSAGPTSSVQRAVVRNDKPVEQRTTSHIVEGAVVRSDQSVQQRTASYLIAMRVLRERPIFGAGLGTSAFYMEWYWPASFSALPSGRATGPTMLSQYATIAAETGLAGFACVAAFTMALIWRLLRLYRRGGDEQALACGLGGMVGAYYLSSAATALVLYQVLLVWLLLAVALAAASATEPAVRGARAEA